MITPRHGPAAAGGAFAAPAPARLRALGSFPSRGFTRTVARCRALLDAFLEVLRA